MSLSPLHLLLQFSFSVLSLRQGLTLYLWLAPTPTGCSVPCILGLGVCIPPLSQLYHFRTGYEPCWWDSDLLQHQMSRPVAQNRHCLLGFCPSLFPVVIINTMTKSNLKEGRVYLVYRLCTVHPQES